MTEKISPTWLPFWNVPLADYPPKTTKEDRRWKEYWSRTW